MPKQCRSMGLIVALVMVAAQVSVAHAAGLKQSGTISGTVQSVTTTTDSSGNTIVHVTILQADGTTQTVDLSADQAASLGLVTLNGDGSVTVNDVIGQSITIDASLITLDPCAPGEGDNQPVASALAGFFCGSLGADYTTIQDWHTSGFGFGVIAQALFMAQALGGDATLAQQILDAKKSKDFSLLVLPDGSMPANWGQLKKDVLSAEMKSLTNLGAIMSGRAQPPTSSSSTTTTTAAPSTTTVSTNNGHGHHHGGNHGKGHHHGK